MAHDSSPIGPKANSTAPGPRHILRPPIRSPGSWQMPKTLSGFVAIVDDDSAVRKALSRLLGASTMRAQSFASAREFLDSLRSGVPECLILDLQMPEMTGLELIAALRRTATGIPVIAISGGDVEAARRMGAAAAFHKPLPVFEMIEAIQGLTKRAA